MTNIKLSHARDFVNVTHKTCHNELSGKKEIHVQYENKTYNACNNKLLNSFMHVHTEIQHIGLFCTVLHVTAVAFRL